MGRLLRGIRTAKSKMTPHLQLVSTVTISQIYQSINLIDGVKPTLSFFHVLQEPMFIVESSVSLLGHMLLCYFGFSNSVSLHIHLWILHIGCSYH